MKKTIPILLLAAAAALPVAAKKVLDHDSFDDWKKVSNYSLTRNGRWAAYAIEPQQGDGRLILRNTSNRREIVVPRGYRPQFSADGRYAVALVRPLYAQTRKAKIDKKKDLDLPQDSLALVNLTTGDVELIPRVTRFRIGKDGGSWVAYESVDTLHAKLADLKDKKSGRPLVVRDMAGPARKIVKWVKDFVFSKDGSRLALTIRKPEKDSLSTDGVGVINLPDTSFSLLARDHRHYGTPVFNEKGDALAYTVSNDSTETGTRRYSLYLADLTRNLPTPKEIDVARTERRGVHLQRPFDDGTPEARERLKEWARRQTLSRGDSLFLNQYSTPLFSHDGRRLVVGVAPEIAPDDTTIYDFERADLDIWRWDAPETPPQEKHNLEEARKKLYPVVINLEDGGQQLLTTNPLATVVAPDRYDADWALVIDPTEHVVSRQWDYYSPDDLSIVNVLSGETRKVGAAPSENYQLSPADRFVVWFKDRDYYSYEIATGQTRCLTAGFEEPLWDIDDDHPSPSTPYGVAAWTEDDLALLVYGKHDIWSLDPLGARAPICLTDGEGKRLNRQFRYRKLDPESRFIKDGQLMTLEVFDFGDKRRGMTTMTYRPGRAIRPAAGVMDKASFYQVRKALDANVFTWMRASFEIAPDIWLATSADFAKAVRLTDSNPQQKEYNWGTAELVRWRAYDGSEAEGVLYKPEDFDPEKSYPLLSVFYERGSDDLYTHYAMEPSWSWVNYPFYVSRGYMVFVPDIHYTAGIPGECAYNYVCSGVEELCRRIPAIDRNRIGIDGQSWGGYQTAYLVTRTNMFACAGSGAPVANMTSAFGGIRWESGDSRQAQYEMGQSRIGRNLWEAPELYIANSPVFHADRVNTPLLIMHNDADGAVPWYQGIEMFMALRRLQKPVWMLQYNSEAHNLRERRNRKDITRRLQQFFDHYLKGDPMPRWMKEGIPAVRKGQDFGFELD